MISSTTVRTICFFNSTGQRSLNHTSSKRSASARIASCSCSSNKVGVSIDARSAATFSTCSSFLFHRSDVCSNSAQALYQQMSVVSDPMTQVNFLVRVYDAPGCAKGSGMLVGSAPGSVTVVNPVTLTAQPPMIDVGGSSDLTASVMAVGGPDGGVDGGATLSYDFSCPTCTAGGLRPAGGGATTAGPLCSETNQVTYVPNANVTQTTKDGVSVTAYNAPGCGTGTGMALGTVSAPVTVTVDKMDAGSTAATGTFVIGGTTFSFSGSSNVYLTPSILNFVSQKSGELEFEGVLGWKGNGIGTYPCSGYAMGLGCGNWNITYVSTPESVASALEVASHCTITITSFGSNPGDRVIGSMSAVSVQDMVSAPTAANGLIFPDVSTSLVGPPISATFDVPAP
jgi:hypothetical protein